MPCRSRSWRRMSSSIAACCWASNPPSRSATICAGRCLSVSFRLMVFSKSSNKAAGIGRRPTLGLSALVQFHQQALHGRLVELQHQPVERGHDALVGQPAACFVNPPARLGGQLLRARCGSRTAAMHSGCAISNSSNSRSHGVDGRLRFAAVSIRRRASAASSRATAGRGLWPLAAAAPSIAAATPARRRGTWPPAAARSSVLESARRPGSRRSVAGPSPRSPSSRSIAWPTP